MQDSPRSFDTSLAGLGWADWLRAADEIVEADGHVETLGPDHAAVFYEDKPILLVTFETHNGLASLSQAAHPIGWTLVKALGWSHLSVIAREDSWFRDRHIYGYFDRLADDGFFDEFDQVIFYGAGACGYAAAAFSVAAPGARVLALHPQATLDPRVTEWDDRFTHMRRTAFDDRYGYAPDMLDAAERAVVIYDPEVRLDAMHAALFTRPNVMKFRMRFLGEQLERDLMGMGVLLRILAQFSADRLDRRALARLYRARHTHVPYLKQVLARLEQDERLYLTALWSQCILRRTPGPRFRRASRAAYAVAEEQGLAMPPRAVE